MRRRPLHQRDLERMNLPRRFWGSRLSGVPNAAVEAVVHRYLSEGRYLRGEGLYLWGKYGVGKSSLAAIIIMELRRRGYSALFVEAADLVDKLMGREMFDLETSWSARAREADVLVLDDLGTEHHDAGGAIERMLEGLLRFRIQRQMPTIVTSNLAPMKLGRHKVDGEWRDGVYRPKLVEMVKEALSPVSVEGESLRQAAGSY